MTCTEKLKYLQDRAVECDDETLRAQYIDAADRLIGKLQHSGEISGSEASDIAREWVSAYACKRGLTLAAINNGHVQ